MVVKWVKRLEQIIFVTRMMISTLDRLVLKMVIDMLNHDYNFIGNEIEKFEDCESCSITSEGKSSTEINTQWSFNSCYSDICDVQGPDTTFYIQSDTNDLDGKQVWGNSQLTMNYNPGRYVKIENDVYYIQMENGKSILKFTVKKEHLVNYIKDGRSCNYRKYTCW